jgi:hypothetical protein
MEDSHMRVLGTLDDVHLIETKSRKITYQRGNLTNATSADLENGYELVSPGFVLLYSDSTIESKTQYGEEVLFYENKTDILKSTEVHADLRVCTASLYTGKKKTRRV